METFKKILKFLRSDKAYKMSISMGVTLFVFMLLMEYVYKD